MGPVFTLRIECDMPGLNGMGGFSSDRETETSELAIVTGREEIFSEPYFEVKTVVRADGFIRDAQGRAAGIFLRVLFRDEEKERYELFPDRPLTIPVPTAFDLRKPGDGYDEDTCFYTLTLRRG